jgi:hypothetical protein
MAEKAQRKSKYHLIDAEIRGQREAQAEKALMEYARTIARRRCVTMTTKEFGAAMVRGTMEGVPQPPTLDEVIEEQKRRGLR